MNTQRLTQDEFIQRCDLIFKNLYSFEKTVYKNTRSNVIVTCKLHGEFTKNARALLLGNGCKACNSKWNSYVERRRDTLDSFITKATELHNGFYSYDNTNYINSRNKVVITCPIHGDFVQTAGGHLEGYGCKKCGDKKHGNYRPWFIKTYFDRFPEKINIPSTLYLLYSEEENFYKIGITTKQKVEDRIKYIKHYKFKIVDTVEDTMYNVAMAEQNILKNNMLYNPKKKFGGYSECLKYFVDIQKYIPSKAGSLE